MRLGPPTVAQWPEPVDMEALLLRSIASLSERLLKGKMRVYLPRRSRSNLAILNWFIWS